MLMRLKLVTVADFRKSEATLLDEAVKKEKLDLGPNEVVCFRSGTGNQVVFVWRRESFSRTRANGKQYEVEIVRSHRLRLPKHRTWDPLMLADYAQTVGIELVGIRKFEEIIEAIRNTARKAA